MIPVLLTLATGAAIVLRAPRRVEWAGAVLLLASCLVAMASIGFFFLPAAVLVLVAVAMDNREPMAT